MSIFQYKVGDIFTLGHYPQTETGELRPIEWQVLEVQPDRVLVLSRFILDWQPFHSADAALPWHHTALRTWLLEKFFPAAFEPQEQKRILHALGGDPVPDAFNFIWDILGVDEGTECIQDPVFLLSQSDVSKYYPCENSLFCPHAETAVTDWVAAQHPDDCWKGDPASWWLRTAERSHNMAYIVSPVASVGLSVVDGKYRQGVRPAMWLKM